MSAAAQSLWTLQLDQRPAALPAEARAPLRPVDSDRFILRRSVAASIGLHVGAVLVALIYHLLSCSELQGRAHDLDISVSIVPISALDTNLAQGVQHPSPVKVPENAEPAPPPKPKPEEKQPSQFVEAKKLSPKKQEPKSPADPKPTDSKETDARASLNAATLGVPNGTGDPSEPARISYQDMVATMLARAKRYPERALRRHTTGEGTIRLRISSQGDVAGFEIVQSTSSPILDEELKDMVERAAPFPPFPKDLRKDSLAIVVPVSFELN